ncbi:MAG: archaellin/type IV pilin N-terminal domain-containing protein [Candidatus Nanoarchaeia archaeon]|jgi:flagellin-like protein
MKSITPIVSVILLVLITIVASVSAFYFINSNVLSLESKSNLDNYPGADNSRLNLVSITGSKAIIRNDGTNPVNEVIVFVNGELLNFTLDNPLQPGELMEIDYNTQLANEDLEIKVVYNKGKTAQATSPASKNTPASGFTTTTEFSCNREIVNFENNTAFIGSQDLGCGCNSSSSMINLVNNFGFEDDFDEWILLSENPPEEVSISTPGRNGTGNALFMKHNGTFEGMPSLGISQNISTGETLSLWVKGSVNASANPSGLILGISYGSADNLLVYTFYINPLSICSSENVICINDLTENSWNYVTVHPDSDAAEYLEINPDNYQRSIVLGVISNEGYFDDFFLNASAENYYCDINHDNVGDGICRSNECFIYESPLTHNASIASFNGMLQGYCNASIQDESQPATYYYNWTKNGATMFNGEMIDSWSITTGTYYSCGITVDGTLKCWGDNNFGKLGIGNTSSMDSPVPVLDTDNYIAVSAATVHTCGITVDGTLKCWGNNSFGQLGIGNTTEMHSPINVSDTDKYIEISSGESHTCGITADGTLKCWGSNDYGELGNGIYGGIISTPAAVPDSDKYVKVAAAMDYTCAITTNGTLKCWGLNFNGQLGIGNTTQMLLPIEVLDSDNYVSVSASVTHTCGITADGTAKCWGSNGNGQLGIGNTTQMLSPIEVLDSDNYVSVSAGAYYSCAINNGSTIKCWGSNGNGQLGIGNTTEMNSPINVDDSDKYLSLSSRYGEHTCAITADGTAKCWGSAGSGQLGGGNGVQKESPAPVLDANKYSATKLFENNSLLVNTILSSSLSSGYWVFSCKVGDGITNSSWVSSEAYDVEI